MEDGTGGPEEIRSLVIWKIKRGSSWDKGRRMTRAEQCRYSKSLAKSNWSGLKKNLKMNWRPDPV